jgi:hypothetical protein
MSRSNNTEVVNPSTRFMEWDGKKGEFRYYDKDLKEKVQVPLPVQFMVLDTLSTIKGFSDANQSGFWSNEVRDTTKDVMSVYNKTGLCEKGLYADIKGSKKCTGIKYCQSVYIALINADGGVSLCNIQMLGAGLSAWIDFCKTTSVQSGAIKVSKSIQGKKGSNVFQIPVFEKIEVDDNLNAEAVALDKVLQDYLTAYFEKQGTTSDKSESKTLEETEQ